MTIFSARVYLSYIDDKNCYYKSSLLLKGDLKYDGYLKSKNKISVKVLKGNIVDFEGKIIVNPSNKNLVLLDEGVSGAIKFKGCN